MAQRLSTSTVNTNIPGVYPDVTVKSTPVGVTSTGDIVIIGEADGGAHYSQETLRDNFFTPTQLDRVRAKYISGPIVDAMAAMVSPSNDTEIQGSVGRVYIVKTNSSAKASALVAANSGSYGSLSDKNFGKSGNKYSYQVIQIKQEVGPSLQGGELDFSDPTIFDGIEFSVRVNGGAEATVTLGTGTHPDIATLASEIDGLLPADLSCSAQGNSLVISHNADVNANEKGYGKSFELIDSSAPDLGALEFSAGLVVSSQEPEVRLEIKRQDTNTNESFNVKADVAMTIGYDGTTASLSISSNTLSTTVVGGSGSNLSVNLNDFSTVADLAAFISSQPGYSATSIADSNNLNPSNLDKVASVDMASATAQPGRIKKANYNFKLKVGQSSSLDFSSVATAGLPADMASVQFLTGGSKGGTSGADVVNSIPLLEGIKVNFVLPLFSRDASEDIADGLTESSSTYTVDAINFAMRSHVLAMSTTKMKRNRVAMLSKYSSYANVKSHAQSLSSYRCIVAFQKSSQVNANGNIVEYMPWHTAAVAVGMQVAGFYKSITNKFANIVSFKDPSGFDSGNPGDIEDAIDAGLLILEQETDGSKWVVDQTTYGFDTNFVYNSLQAVYMSDTLAIQLSESLNRFVVGKSQADINAASIAGHINKKMEEFKRLKITAPSDDAPLGYKGLKIGIVGPVANVKLEAKLASTILFVPLEIELSQVQSEFSENA